MRALTVIFAVILCCIGTPASAQWIYNPDTAPITNAQACAGGTPETLTYNVTTPGTVADVDFGFRAEHSWRGDIRARLTSPAATTVELLTPNTGAGGNLDNYRVRFDDEAGVAVNTGSHAVDQTAAGDRYEVPVRPDNPLSAFDGQAANGTWTLEICDNFPAQDNGTVFETTLFVTPTALPVAPTLSCAVGTPIPFDWDLPGGTNGWAAGSLVNGYTAGTIPLAFAVTGQTARLIPRNGTTTPVTSAEFASPGGTPALLTYANFINTTETIVITLNLGTAGIGVDAVQFDLQDVDRNGWQDQITVSGSLSGTAVAPVLTPGLGNQISGTAVVGTALVATGDRQGDGTITFSSPIDQVVLSYGNAAGASANPPPQVMTFFAEMNLCPRAISDLLAVKSVEAADVDSLMTPGSEVIYKITVTHDPASNRDATDLDISDTLPPTLRFVSATSTGFTTGSFTNPALPAANTDCTGGACVVSFEGGVLPNAVTGVIEVTALIK